MNNEYRRKIITMARDLVSYSRSDLMKHTSSIPGDDIGMYAAAFGEAKVLLNELADMMESSSPGNGEENG